VPFVWPADEPWETNYSRETNDALKRAWGPSDDYWRRLGPPLPQIPYLPPRFGFPPYSERQWGVMQVFGLTRTPAGRIPGMPQTRGEDRTDYTENQGGYEGSDRNTGSGDRLGMGGVSW
jgi:hypothetical protein